ncbi:MAG: MFS transporter [Marmoricola sp.]
MSTSQFGWRPLIAPAYVPAASASTAHGAMLAVLVLQALDLGASAQLTSLIAAGFGVGSLLFSLLGRPTRGEVRRAPTPPCRRHDRCPSHGGGLEHFVVGAVGCSGRGFWGHLVGLLLARQSFLIDAVEEGWRARAMSMLGGMHRVGMVVGPLLATPVIHAFGLRAVFLVSAVLSQLAAVLSARIPDMRHDSALAQTSMVAVLREQLGVLLTVGTAVMVISATRAIRTLVLPLWAHHLNFAPTTTALVMSVSAAFDLVLFYPSGWIMDRFGRTWVAGSCVGALGLGVLLLPLTHTVAWVCIVAGFMGVGNGLASGIVMTLGADNAPPVGLAAVSRGLATHQRHRLHGRTGRLSADWSPLSPSPRHWQRRVA